MSREHQWLFRDYAQKYCRLIVPNRNPVNDEIGNYNEIGQHYFDILIICVGYRLTFITLFCIMNYICICISKRI